MTDTPTLQTRFLAQVVSQFGVIETTAQHPLDAKWSELKPDSLDAVELSVWLEDEFRIELSDDELEPFFWPDGLADKTLRDFLSLIEAKLGAVTSGSTVAEAEATSHA